MQKKILVTDDHAIVRRGIVGLLKEQHPFFQFDEAADTADTEVMLRKDNYDLLILDLNLPDANVEKLLSRIRAVNCSIPIIVFSMFPDEVMLKPLKHYAVRQYINKSANPSELKNAVRNILFRTVHNQQPIANAENIKARNPFARLSAKEMLVLFALLEGLSNRQISDNLQLSQSTVATYKQRIFEKLSIRSNMELAELAFEFNIRNMNVASQVDSD